MICSCTRDEPGTRPPFSPETDCPVDRAMRLMDDARRAACGKDMLCREGSLQVYTILADIAGGEGREEDIPLLEELLEVIRQNAGCTMAAGAAEECLALLRDEQEAFIQHIMRKRCAALVCPSMYTLHVLPAACTGCGRCAGLCPAGAIAGGDGLIHVIDNARCTRCLACMAACPARAIEKAGAVKPKGPESPVPVGSFEEGGGRRRRRRG